MHTPGQQTSTRSLRRTAVALLVAAVATVLGALAIGAGPASAAGTDDVTWAVRTASNNFGATRTSYSYNLNPGGKVSDSMVVVNHGTKSLKLAAYASDGYTTEGGQLDLLTTGQKSTSIGAWVHTKAANVVVKPGATAKVPFTVAIPDNATPGDYAGGIVTSLVQADQTDGINVDRRLGIRMQIRVTGELRPTLAVENLKIKYSGSIAPLSHGDATLTYTVHNTGNALLSAQQSASVAGPWGWFKTKAGEIADTPQLLPGESWKVSVPLKDVTPALRLTAHVALTPVVIDASGSKSTLEPVSGYAHAWAFPWMLLLALVVLIGIAVAGGLAVRRNRARRKQLTETRVAEAVAEALREREDQQS